MVRMTVAAQDSTVKLPPDFEGMFVEAFRSRFTAPKKLPMRVVAGWQPCDSLAYRCASGVLNLSAAIYVTAHNNGTLSNASVIDESITPAFADSLRSALTAMSKAKDVPPTGEAETIPLAIRVAPELLDSAQGPTNLFRAVVPHYGWPFSSASMPEAGVNPSYPFTARVAGVEDSVAVAFTVDADGSIAPESIDLVSANYREFVAAVVKALLQARYHPAHLGDCAVAARMKQRFVFKAPQ
jgi:TonB family protein